MEYLGSLALIVVGLVLGLIGGGGAILTMPILVYLYAIAPLTATSYSLFIVGCVSLVGVWRYHHHGLVNYRTAILFVLPSLIGTYLARHQLLPVIPEVVISHELINLTKDRLIMVVFACVMMAASVSMIRPSATVGKEGTKGHTELPKLLTLGFLVGFVAGFVGAGGGFLIIPALVVLGGVSMRVAVPTSLFIIATNSLVAFAGDLVSQAQIDWLFLIKTCLAAAIGLLAGVALAPRFHPVRLKVGFGWFVLVMGAAILAKQLV